MHDSTRQLLENMADAVDLRDPYTGSHSRRVTACSAAILQELGLHGPEVDLIVTAARVHDIGKIGTPDAVLNKSGQLTPEERAVMEEHPVKGAQLLKRHRDFARGVALVRHHHESWDGTGYPDRLKGAEIPFGARVIAVADSYDAMTSDRPYRKGLPIPRAAGILREGRGRQWDAAVVDAFLRTIANQLEQAPQCAAAGPPPDHGHDGGRRQGQGRDGLQQHSLTAWEACAAHPRCRPRPGLARMCLLRCLADGGATVCARTARRVAAVAAAVFFPRGSAMCGPVAGRPGAHGR
jgi:putative nucleotidyltransferase with HDIG domain